MPIRHVMQKRKGKASKRNHYSSRTAAIRVMRACFFIIVGLLIVYLYFLYENGSLLTLMQSIFVEGILVKVKSYIEARPFLVLFFIINNFIVFGVGYLIGKKGLFKSR